MTNLILLFLSSIFVHNILLSRFLGCCPFMGVSSKSETANGMGAAVVFVIMLASLMTWLTYNYLLVPCYCGVSSVCRACIKKIKSDSL